MSSGISAEAVSPAPAQAVTTAGLRGAHWNPERMPAGVQMTAHSLKTADKAVVTGYLFRRGSERTVVCAMHPREALVTQYLVPDILSAGCAMWILAGRSAGNDLRLEHEAALLDLAAGQQFLRGLGFEKRVLLGTSGGGPLATFYSQQSRRAADERIKRSPGGKPIRLADADMPAPDGLILVSSHLGQGKLLQNCIDPSVIDESDPLSIDDSLSIFNPANGFLPPPESSTYESAFIARYRDAQVARVARIDVIAKNVVLRKQEAKRLLEAGRDHQAAILAAYSPVFAVWRTDADPRCFSLSMEPTERAYGSLWGANPLASNYGSAGFARVCTAESWLSNWSALSSNATMAKCAPDLHEPVLMIEYTGDNSVFPSEANLLFDMLGTSDKTRLKVSGNHHGMAIRPGSTLGQIEAGKRIGEWLEEKRFIS